jgi:uncharacterized protein (TIGR02646 family)
MIRLKLFPKPNELTPEKQKELTIEYQNQKTKVWDQPYIKKNLLKMSDEKCCYCECKVTEESKYLEVEHFFPRHIYPEKVLEWENLLPSCKRCNGKKGSHDTGIIPLIHPVNDNPKEHLYFKNYQIRAKKNSKLGEITVDILDLNNTHRLTIKRFQIGEKFSQTLLCLSTLANRCFGNGTITMNEKNRLSKTLEGLLIECTPSSEYSATAAAVLSNDEYYIGIKKQFIDNGLWNMHLAELEVQAKICALDVCN